MKSRAITTSTPVAPLDDPGWDAVQLRGMGIGIVLALIGLAIGPFLGLVGLAWLPGIQPGQWAMPLFFSLGYGISGAVLAVLLALPLSWLLARGDAGKPADTLATRLVRLARFVVVVVLVCPPALTTFGVIETGAVLSLVGISDIPWWLFGIVANAVLGLPVAALTLEAAWRNIDPDDERTALTLGWRPSSVFFVLVRPKLVPFVRPAFGLALARVLGERAAFMAMFGQAGAPLAVTGFGLHVTNTGVERATIGLLLAVTIGVLWVCKSGLFTLIPHVSHRFSTHLYMPDNLEVEGIVEGEGADTEDEETPGEELEDVESFFASLDGPGLAYAETLSDEEVAYLTKVDTEGVPRESIWDGAAGMPKAWAEPGTYWPVTQEAEVTSVIDQARAKMDTQAKDREPVSASTPGSTMRPQAKGPVESLSTEDEQALPPLRVRGPKTSANDGQSRPQRSEDDDTSLGARTSSPFLRIRTRDGDAEDQASGGGEG